MEPLFITAIILLYVAIALIFAHKCLALDDTIVDHRKSPLMNAMSKRFSRKMAALVFIISLLLIVTCVYTAIDGVGTVPYVYIITVAALAGFLIALNIILVPLMISMRVFASRQ